MSKIILFFYCTLFSIVGSHVLSAEKLTKNEIYEIQEKLSILGFDAGKPDGLIGRKTKSAVMGLNDKFDKPSESGLTTLTLGNVRDVYLENADIVLNNLLSSKFTDDALSQIIIPENYRFFIDGEKLSAFHAAYGRFTDPIGTIKRNVWDLDEYFDQCEQAISIFDLSWNEFEIQTRVIRCLTAFSQLHFKHPNDGIKPIQNILLSWSKLKPVIYRGRRAEEDRNQFYAAALAVSSIAQFYAVYYDSFDLTNAERDAINLYLRNWLMSEDLFPKVGLEQCPMKGIEKAFAQRKISFDVNYCGSNRWRMAIASVYLGLRLNDQQLFLAGNRHVFLASAAIDQRGTYTPWARKGSLALSYQRQLPEVLTFLSDAYQSVGFDFNAYKTLNGPTIAAAYERVLSITQDPELVHEYAKAEPNYNGDSYSSFRKLPLDVKLRRELIYPKVLKLQSADYLHDTHGAHVDLHLVDEWGKNWNEFIGVFMMTSGVAVNYAKNTVSNIAKHPVTLPLDLIQNVQSSDNQMLCSFVIKTSLIGDPDPHALAMGILAHDGQNSKLQDVEWMVDGEAPTDSLMTHSSFKVTPQGGVKGIFALDNLENPHGRQKIWLVKFDTTQSDVSDDLPVGVHISKTPKRNFFLDISGCQKDVSQLKRLYWKTELKSEDYKTTYEAMDVLALNNTKIADISHVDTSIDGVKGREQLKYEIINDTLKISGTVDVLNGDMVSVSAQIPFSESSEIISFGDNDRLILSWN